MRIRIKYAYQERYEDKIFNDVCWFTFNNCGSAKYITLWIEEGSGTKKHKQRYHFDLSSCSFIDVEGEENDGEEDNSKRSS